MNTARGIARLARGARSMNTSAVVRAQEQIHPGYKNIKPIQERFCTNDGTPVHIKGGAVDNILYRFTMGACIVAVLMDVKLYLELGMK